MLTEQQRWDSVAQSRDVLAPLATRAREYLAKLPEIQHLAERRDRVRNRWMGHSKFARRARLIFDALNAKIRFYFKEFRAFTGESLIAIEQLRNILPPIEVDSLKKEIDPSMVGTTCRAVQRATQKLEELWECRPDRQVLPDREPRLQEFLKNHHTTIAEVMKAARVYKAEMQKWRHGKLPDKSVMSHRIEDVLSGKRSLEPGSIHGQRTRS